MKNHHKNKRGFILMRQGVAILMVVLILVSTVSTVAFGMSGTGGSSNSKSDSSSVSTVVDLEGNGQWIRKLYRFYI